MYIGEKMSEVTDTGRVFTSGRDLYEDEVRFRLNKPLDLGRLLYMKLFLEIDPPVEVIWNHFDKELVVITANTVVVFQEMVMARSDMLERIDQFVAQIKERESSIS